MFLIHFSSVQTMIFFSNFFILHFALIHICITLCFGIDRMFYSTFILPYLLSRTVFSLETYSCKCFVVGEMSCVLQSGVWNHNNNKHGRLIRFKVVAPLFARLLIAFKFTILNFNFPVQLLYRLFLDGVIKHNYFIS